MTMTMTTGISSIGTKKNSIRAKCRLVDERKKKRPSCSFQQRQQREQLCGARVFVFFFSF
jgi:hypothetical protein